MLRLKVRIFVYLLFILLSVVIPLKTAAKGNKEVTNDFNFQSSNPNISKQLFILEDKDKQWDIGDVRKEPLFSHFERNTMTVPNYGYTSSTYWVYFEVENNSTFTEKVLEIPYPPLNEIDIYMYGHNGELLQELQLGAKYPFDERPLFYPNFSFYFDVEENEQRTFFIRFDTEGSMQMPIQIWERSEFVAQKQLDYLFFGIFYGITGVMALYNLFLFFSLKHTSYLYYVLVILSTSMISICLNGIGFQYLWPDSPWWNMRSIVFFMSLATVLGLLFTDSFLDLKQHLPKWRKYLYFLLMMNMLNALFVFITYQPALRLLVFNLGAMIVIILSAAFIVLRRGVRQARFFIVAWSVFLFGVLISMLADAALIPLTPFTKNVWQLSVSMEVILLSLALADRINILQKEKNEAVLESHKSQKQAIENLKRADQLKDEFLAMTSHELRTPITGIIGIAETLQNGAAGQVSKKMYDHLSLIVLSGKRLSNLINDLLDFTKLKNKELQLNLAPVNMKEITDVVLTVCRPLLQDKNIRLQNKMDEKMAPVHADENRVQQILYNLIGNAIKYTDRGEIVIWAQELDNYIQIAVSDTGRGIPATKQDFIFDDFYQIKLENMHEIGSSGIGLSITKQLVELHEGNVHVESTLHEGSTFYFTLKKYDEQSFAKEEIALSIHSFPFQDVSITKPEIAKITERKGTILVADDEMVNVQVLFNHLALDGYHVILAKDGEEVLQKVNENEIDLLVLDIMMPKMSGYEVCQQLRQKYSLMELPVLMLTAKNQLHDKLTSFQAGANDYLTKPCESKELLSRVKTLVQLSQLHKQLLQFNRLLEEKVDERTTELQLVNDRLTEVAKSRQHLLANISHELGTPVTVIHGYVQAVRDRLIPANDSNYLQLVVDKVKLLTRLIDDLADLSKLEGGQISFQKQKVNVQEWINEIRKVYKIEVMEANRTFLFPQNENNMFLDFHCFIDKERMHQVFSNLIWNAIKHTDEETGQIAITVQIADQQNEIIFAVEDNGDGIAEEKIAYIFERFYKSYGQSNEKKYRGTGLGLAIVKEIVRVHHGRIWVKSEVEIGSIFYVALPLHA